MYISSRFSHFLSSAHYIENTNSFFLTFAAVNCHEWRQPLILVKNTLESFTLCSLPYAAWVWSPNEVQQLREITRATLWARAQLKPPSAAVLLWGSRGNLPTFSCASCGWRVCTGTGRRTCTARGRRAAACGRRRSSWRQGRTRRSARASSRDSLSTDREKNVSREPA